VPRGPVGIGPAMPVNNDAVGAAGGYRLPAGTYAKLLRDQCEMRCEIEYVHSNPRCNVLVVCLQNKQLLLR
jgi:hypothetical protein